MASTIGDVMTTPPLAVTTQTSVREAAQLMADEELDSLPVVDDGPASPKQTALRLDLLGLQLLDLRLRTTSTRRSATARSRLVGIITAHDVAVRVVGRGLDPRKTRVGDVASNDVVTLSTDDDLDKALRTMSRAQMQRLPVVNHENELVGTVARTDIRPQ